MATVTEIPFPCDKLAVPSQDRVGREQCAHFVQAFSTKNSPFDGESTTLVVGEQDALLPNVLLEHLVLGSQVVV